MEFTHRRNINRGYMKLEVWNEGLQLFKYIHDVTSKHEKIDIRLKSQLLDSAQSISANIAEGYSRRSINEYLYFLNIALGSASELMTRIAGLKSIGFVSFEVFDHFDTLHYSVENKLLSLIKALQSKRKTGSWEDEFREAQQDYQS